MSLHLCAIMHVEPLPNDDDDGYMIVTRSLQSGAAGCHTDMHTSRIRRSDSNSNEVLVGVNILRRVPNDPTYTDLITVSQVASGFVPQFLTKRIGMAGLDDFFKNVRAIGDEMHS
mmetsp:Transcript_22593/g.64003  ORF Transcript_22593/g.64003 Transcript_22593/m.64003 type:complete len:115 (-) Transcript_22593:67-411(-)